MERLGAWTVERHLASGGQAEVWAARHARTGLVAAIKRPRGEVAERHLPVFAREMRSITALDHPRIVQILDVGDQGEPWIAMELATGTLLGAVQDWSEAVRATAAVLDALAHAHGRGVLHLDLKPANVLLGCAESADEVGDDAPPGLRLSDFGLSQDVREVGPSRGHASGTPGFMAPEQIRGERGRFGPETDLYAVGALMWELCAGRPPFVGATQDVLRGQLRGSLPPLVPRFGVPPLLAEWLGWCLAPTPSLRPQRAADLLHALRSLGSADEPIRVSRPTSVDPGAATVDVSLLDEPTAGAPEELRRWPQATAPASWRRPETWRRARPQPDGGLAMVGLRAPRLVGRQDERDRLWAALRAVQVDRRGAEVRPRVVVLRGPKGAGASALARWLGDRAHECGGAHVLRVHHADPPGDDDGLEGAISHWGHLRGLEGPDLEERLADVLRALLDPAPWMVRQLAAWLDGRASLEPASFAVSLCSAWNRRPLLLLVDDAACGPATLAFVEALLQQGEVVPLRVMVVLATGGDGPVASRLEALRARAGVDTLTLGPLEPVDLELLLREWVGLARGLADRVTAESRGLPGDALALVAALRARDLLVSGAEGLALRPGADLVETDQGPLATASEALGGDEDALRRLEAAAVAGDRVDPAPEALIDLGLLRVDPRGGVVFASADLRRALVRRATEGGRVSGWHLRAARGEGLAPQVSGEHLLLGGLPAEAIDPLLVGARQLADRRDFRRALAAAERAGEALLAADPSRSDPRWSRQRRLVLETTAVRGYSRELLALTEQTLAEAAERGWDEAYAHALELRGWCRHLGGDDGGGVTDAEAAEVFWGRLGDLVAGARCRTNHALFELSRGRVERALLLAEEAVAGLSDAGRPALLVTARVAAANALQRSGRWDEAGEHLLAARRVALSHGDPLGLGRVARQLAVLRTQQGRFEEALDHAREATELARRDGTWMAMAHGHSLVSDALRGLGRLDEATTEALAALDLYQRLGAEADIPTTNLAILHLLRGDDTAALERAQQVSADHSPLIRAVVGLVRVAALVGLGREAEARAAWPPLARTLAEVREVESDLTLLRAEVDRRAPWTRADG